MAKRKGSSASGPRTRSKAAREGREARDPGSIQWLDKLPLEVWDKILDHLESDDLFPLALSCRYFRQKQKELVARTRQSGPGSGQTRLALKTNLRRRLYDGQPASADYLRFCSKEEVPSEDAPQRAILMMIRLAAYHGHLPLLQEFLESSEALQPNLLHIAYSAGEPSSSSQSLLLLCFGF